MDVALTIEAAWHLDHLQKLHYDNLTRKQLKQIKLIAYIVKELENAIEALEGSPREHLRSAYPSNKLPLEEIHNLGDAARLASENREQRPAQRPPRSFKHRGLHFLIEALYRLIVVEAQGELTLWENRTSGGLGGTIPEVLELLQPYIAGLLPRKLNFSTLQRALSRAKKAHAS
jgi:hypothetical protein